MRAFVCGTMIAIAGNALLVQTVWPPDSPLRNIARFVVIGLTVIIVAMGRRKVPFLVLAVAVVSLCLMVVQNNPDQLTYAFVAVYALALCSIDPRWVLKYAALASAIVLAALMLFLQTGLTADAVLELRDRQTFGARSVPYVYNVVYGAASLSILYAWKYLDRRVAWASIAVGVAIGSYFYAATDIRGGYFSLLAFVALLVATSAFRVSRFYSTVVGLIPVFGLASIATIASLEYTRWNDILSGRPRLVARYLDNLSFESVILGSSVKATDQTGIIDNSYLHLLAGGGLLITIAACFLFLLAARQLGREGRAPELAFLAATASYFFVESIFVRAENPFVLYVWFLLLSTTFHNTQEASMRTPPNRQAGIVT